MKSPASEAEPKEELGAHVKVEDGEGRVAHPLQLHRAGEAPEVAVVVPHRAEAHDAAVVDPMA